MTTSRLIMVVFAGLLSGAVIPDAFAQNLPAGANTTDPKAPFYIDLTGLDFKTNPPTRNPLNPNYPPAIELPAGALPSVQANGNFIIGPTHLPAPEVTAQPGVPQGKLYKFTIRSTDSKIYPTAFIRSEPNLDAAVATAKTVAGDPSNMILTTVGAGTWSRVVQVYVPRQVQGNQPTPFIVVGDGNLTVFGPSYGAEAYIFPTLDNLIHQRRIPPMVGITIESGGQDAQGSQRGFEYDTVSGTYAEFVETEVLPLVEKIAGVRLTHDPNARIAMGASSGSVAALSMAWFHPEWYRRVLSYSGTFVNQQWPHNPALPGGAWELHSPWAGPAPNPLLRVEGFIGPQPSTLPAGSPLIANAPRQPIRVWFEVGDRDAWYGYNLMVDGMHDQVLANENLAKVLAAKGYEYQFIFARNAVHADSPTIHQTFPRALEYLMQGYRPQDDEHWARR
jgi:S-formylglutathione hydrolase FrmB